MTADFEAGLMAVAPLEVHTQLGREWAVLNVRGELDILTSPDLAAILEAVRQDRRQVAVDLAGVRFVDAHGLRVLVEAARTMLDRGQFVITCPTPLFRRLLAVTGLESEVKLLDQRPMVSGYHNALRF